MVAWDDARRSLKDLADGAAAFLAFAEATPELIGEPGMLRPMMPTERLVMRRTVRRDPLDRIIGKLLVGHHHSTQVASHSLQTLCYRVKNNVYIFAASLSMLG
jgi:hypothetical protein